MIKFGILDFDTSHCVAFTQRLNHVDVKEDQWVEGGRVVIGCPGESKLSPERIPGFTETMKKYGVPLVDKPEEMIGKVDAMLIESVDGSVHWERSRIFMEAGIPCFVDKPFACSLDDAKKMADLAEKKKLPLFSSSSLRYAQDVADFVKDEGKGKVVGCDTYGPAPLDKTNRNPGLFHYGIHPVEILYAVMGPGCQRVVNSHSEGTDLVTGTWKDGRIGTVRGIRDGRSAYGYTAFTDKAVKPVTVGTGYIYRELLKQIVTTFATGKAPLDINETLELIAFIEAANKSGDNHGTVQSVKV